MPGALMDFTSGQTPVLIIRWLETSSSVGAKGLTLRKLICNCLTLKLQAYLNPSFGRDKRVLEFSDVANTFLHSYGNALECPCEYRQSGFSQHSLLHKGLIEDVLCSQGCITIPDICIRTPWSIHVNLVNIWLC